MAVAAQDQDPAIAVPQLFRRLSDYGVTYQLPIGSLAIFVAVAIVAGLGAALLPARRASRLNVLEALQYE